MPPHYLRCAGGPGSAGPRKNRWDAPKRGGGGVLRVDSLSRRPRMLARIALLCCCLMLAPLAHGQGNAPELNPPISLDFGGGTLSQFVDAVKKGAAQVVADSAVNVVFAEPRVAQFQVPAIQLQHVSVESALRAAVHPRARAEGNERPMLEQVG